ncbi:unnamed protein product [Dovyalis caffra]|uniref:Ribulose-1,5-bisphosphate carboxylase/oxygenase large subunit n=1 Tax=Dovyalis caffra TaxID=77055 RepID=A0AAV1QYX5_9ROSI|nr:unnamed protein product [Dovyalis caffra]
MASIHLGLTIPGARSQRTTVTSLGPTYMHESYTSGPLAKVPALMEACASLWVDCHLMMDYGGLLFDDGSSWKFM